MVPECCICLESFYLCKTSCGHDICCGCLIELKDLTCPICRTFLTNLPKSVKDIILSNNEHLRQVINNRVLDLRDLMQFPPLDRDIN